MLLLRQLSVKGNNMRWKTTFLFSLASCFFCANVYSQNLPYTPSTGGVGVGGGVGLPVNILSDYPTPYANKAPDYRARYLYKPADFSLSPGLWAITNIAFKDSIPQVALLRNFTIRMKTTSATELSAIPDDDNLTVVFGPQPYYDHASWNDHELINTFCWDGVSNLIVDICVQNDSAEKSYNSSVFATVEKYNAAYHDFKTNGSSLCDKDSLNKPQLYTRRPLLGIAKFNGYKVELKALTSVSPSPVIQLYDTTKVSFSFKNRSCTALNGSLLSYQWNQDPVVTEQYNQTLNPTEIGSYTFKKEISAVKAGFNFLKIFINNVDDQIHQNDTITKLVWVNDTMAPLPYNGKDFWLGFMQNYDNKQSELSQKLFFTSTSNATVKISAPLAGTWTKTINVPKYSVQSIDIPYFVGASVMATPNSEVVSNTGIKITSDRDIVVYGISRQYFSTDGYLAIPTKTIGKEYVITAPEGIYNIGGNQGGVLGINAPAEFMVVASEDGTSVSIHCSEATEKHSAGSTWNVSLNQGESYLVKGLITYSQATGQPNGTSDLSGSTIIADKPVSVFGGAICAMVPGLSHLDKCASCDHLIEQLLPTSLLGLNYYSNDFGYKPGDDMVRVVGVQSGVTTVMANGTPYTIAGPGKFIEFKFTGTLKINASAPVQVSQMCTGGQCKPVSSTDPFMLNLIPESQWGNYYSFVTAPGLFPVNMVNLVKKGKNTYVGIDGELIPNARFTNIPGTEYYAVQYGISAGPHNAMGDDIFSCYVYGFGTDDSYGYPASGSKITQAVLPLGLISLQASAKYNKEVDLKWFTASEKACKEFVLERSYDLKQFSDIARLKAAGTSASTHYYSFVDKNPERGAIYYRIRSVFEAGEDQLSTISTVNLKGNSLLKILAVAPSPIGSDNTLLELTYSTASSAAAIIRVLSIDGSKVFEKKIEELEIGLNRYQLNTSAWKNGMYFLSIQQGNLETVSKVIK